MDRISAIRNVEDALSDFEAGEIDLATLEERVTGTLRTYVADLEAEAPAAAGRPFRVDVPGHDEPVVVVADDAAGARERAATITDTAAGELTARKVE